jgi:hypothetical protein
MSDSRDEDLRQGGEDTAGTDPPADATSSVAVKEKSIAQLQSQLDEYIDSSELLPLMGTFQEYIEAEKRRNARRFAGLGVAFGAVLLLFVLVPVYFGGKMLRRAEQAFAADRASLIEMRGTVESNLVALASATERLRIALEEQGLTAAAGGPAKAGMGSDDPLLVAARAEEALRLSRQQRVSPSATNAAAAAAAGVADTRSDLLRMLMEVEETLANLGRRSPEGDTRAPDSGVGPDGAVTGAVSGADATGPAPGPGLPRVQP